MDKSNTIAVFVDPNNGDEGGRARGSGWWYEGGGLYRDVKLIKTSSLVHIAHDGGLFVYSNNITIDPISPAAPLLEDDIVNEKTALVQGKKEVTKFANNNTAIIYINIDVQNENTEKSVDVCVGVTILDDEIAPPVMLMNDKAPPIYSIEPGETITVKYKKEIHPIKLWTSLTPHLYDVTANIYDCTNRNPNVPHKLLDSVKTYHGFRTIHFTSNHGFFLNKAQYKIRGFCDHDNFGIVGMAVPERINLFRVSIT